MNRETRLSVELENISREDLALAYRKAKVDLFYSNDARASDLVEYEDSLVANLDILLENLESSFNG